MIQIKISDIRRHDVTWRHSDVITNLEDQKCWHQHIFDTCHHWYVFFWKSISKYKKLAVQPVKNGGLILISFYLIFLIMQSLYAYA